MNIELRFSSSFTSDDSIDKKYVCHGQLDTPYGSLYMICSGIEDSSESAIASSMTFEIIRRIVTSIPGRSAEELLSSGIREANRAVFNKISSNLYMHGIGTEYIALLIDTDEMRNALVCHVGCSRIFRIWDGVITRITKGHLRGSAKIDQGIKAEKGTRIHGENKMLARSIGIRTEIEPEIRRIFVQVGDRYIMCTSSITDHIDETEIVQLYEVNAQQYADSILIKATNRGSKNNPVVQIIDIVSSSESDKYRTSELIESNQHIRREQ